MKTQDEAIVRRGGVDDLAMTAQLWDRANAAYGRTLAVEHQGQIIIESIAKRIRDDGAELLIAEIGGKLAGMLLGSPSREEHGKGRIIPGLAHVSWVATEREYWGRGIATLLMQALLERLREKKFQRVQLWTHQDNVRAQRVYERLGFRLTGQQMMDSAGALIVQYERDL